MKKNYVDTPQRKFIENNYRNHIKSRASWPSVIARQFDALARRKMVRISELPLLDDCKKEEPRKDGEEKGQKLDPLITVISLWP